MLHILEVKNQSLVPPFYKRVLISKTFEFHTLICLPRSPYNDSPKRDVNRRIKPFRSTPEGNAIKDFNVGFSFIKN